MNGIDLYANRTPITFYCKHFKSIRTLDNTLHFDRFGTLQNVHLGLTSFWLLRTIMQMCDLPRSVKALQYKTLLTSETVHILIRICTILPLLFDKSPQ